MLNKTEQLVNMSNDAYSNMEVDMQNLMGELSEDADMQKMERMKNRRVCIIENCRDCPHYERIFCQMKGGDIDEHYCHLLDENLKNPSVIPTDCPLPKYKETAAV